MTHSSESTRVPWQRLHPAQHSVENQVQKREPLVLTSVLTSALMLVLTLLIN